MKIGIIGNMNNMYFPLARYLADEGYDCELLLFDYEPSHFHPSADSFQEKFDFTMKSLNWGDPASFFNKANQAKSDLQDYDVLIGSGSAPAFVKRIGRKLDLFIPYGEDLYVWPFVPLVHPRRQLSYMIMAWYQMRGILECPYILFDKASENFEKVFKRLRYKGKRIVSPPPLFYYREYENNKALFEQGNPSYHFLNTLRLENDLLILQHIRQFWKPHYDKWHMKGNDLLIKGYAQFIRNNPQVRSKLLLFEYGRDVMHSKTLIRKLNIEDHVVWFPKTLRKNLLYFIKTSDVVVGELTHSWNTYCVVHETLAMSKPLMHKRADEELSGSYNRLYPMLCADSVQTVYDGLLRVAKEKEEIEVMGQEGYQWFLDYCVKVALAHIKNIIEEKKNHA